MLRLQIDTQFARLGHDIRLPAVQLEIAKPRVELETNPPTVQVDIDWPKVEVDDREARAEIGLKRTDRMAREYAAVGRQTVLQGIKRRASQGDELAAVETGTSVADVAYREAWPEDNRQINVTLMPKSPVKIEAKGGVSISTDPGTLELRLRRGAADVGLRYGTVATELAARPQIEIEAVGDRFSALG